MYSYTFVACVCRFLQIHILLIAQVKYFISSVYVKHCYVSQNIAITFIYVLLLLGVDSVDKDAIKLLDFWGAIVACSTPSLECAIM